jgi:hypothetical protein
VSHSHESCHFKKLTGILQDQPLPQVTGCLVTHGSEILFIGWVMLMVYETGTSYVAGLTIESHHTRDRYLPPHDPQGDPELYVPSSLSGPQISPIFLSDKISGDTGLFRAVYRDGKANGRMTLFEAH